MATDNWEMPPGSRGSTGDYNTYFVMWTYAANYSRVMQLKAASPKHAADMLLKGMSSDFEKKGNVYVWESPPVYKIEGGK